MSCFSLFVLAVIFGVASMESIPVVDITGGGLELVERINEHERQYMYKYKEPGDLNLSCTLSGAMGLYLLELHNDQDVGPRELFVASNYSSVSHTFTITPRSNMTRCTATDVRNVSSYTSRVHLEYEHEPAPPGTPSISTSTTRSVARTSPEPTETTTAEYKKTVTFNIEVDSKAFLKCAANPVGRLVQGDKLQILAKAPGVVSHMWCQDKGGNKAVDRCEYDSEKKQCSAVTDNLKAFEGNWTCVFLLQRNTSILPTTFRDNIAYNYAECKLLIYVQATTRSVARTSPEPTETTTAAQTRSVTTTSPEPIEPTEYTADNSPQYIVIVCSCVTLVALVVILIFVIICYRRGRKQVHRNEIVKHVMSRPPIDLPPEVVYDEVYSHGAGLARPRDKASLIRNV